MLKFEVQGAYLQISDSTGGISANFPYLLHQFYSFKNINTIAEVVGMYAPMFSIVGDPGDSLHHHYLKKTWL